MRHILDEFNLTLHPTVDEADPLNVKVCGPSDSDKSVFQDAVVVVLTWRSPFGDDLLIEMPRDLFVNRLT